MLVVERVTVGSSAPVDVQSIAVEQGDLEQILLHPQQPITKKLLASLFEKELPNHIKETLNIKNGETTADGLFTLKTAECLGACGYAPMMQLGKFYHEHLTKEKVTEILELCRQGQVDLD